MLFCLDVDLPSSGIGRYKQFDCAKMNPAYESLSQLEREAYIYSNLRVHQITNRQMEFPDLNRNSILATFINGFSGHVFDSLVALSLFIIEPDID
jgi:hypothetical protein